MWFKKQHPHLCAGRAGVRSHQKNETTRGRLGAKNHLPCYDGHAARDEEPKLTLPPFPVVFWWMVVTANHGAANPTVSRFFVFLHGVLIRDGSRALQPLAQRGASRSVPIVPPAPQPACTKVWFSGGGEEGPERGREDDVGSSNRDPRPCRRFHVSSQASSLMCGR